MPTHPHRLNRRNFAATVSASTMVATLPQALAESPNEQIGVCIVGLNGRGGEHIRGFLKDPRSRITAIVDIDDAVGARRAQQIEEQQGNQPEVFQDIRQALVKGKFDVLACATPNHWHALCGVWAMQAGKDVYVEKPISHNIQEGRALVAAAKKYGRVFQTGTQCRSSDACIEAVNFIAEGGIGEVNFARGLCYKRRKSIGPRGDYSIPQSIDFDLWSGPATLTTPRLTRKNFHYDWHWQRAYGNGDSGNQGPHQTDIARWGLGLNRHPRTITSYGGRLGYQAERNDPNYVDAGDTANTQVSIYDYGDKCIIFETRGLDVSQSAGPEVDAMFGKEPGNKIGVIFYGSEGYVAQIRYGYCKAFDKEMNPIKDFHGKNVGDRHFANFLDAVESRDFSMLHADATCGHLSAAIAHHGNTSYYLGESNHASPDEIAEALSKIKSLDDNRLTLDRTVSHLQSNGVDLGTTPLSLGPTLRFDPETERYTNNNEANQLLTRNYRADFAVPTPEKV